MNVQMIGLVLNIILNLVQNLTNNKSVDDIINLLEQWIPTILNEASGLIPVVQEIIDTLKGSSVLTADQIAAVDNLNTQSDADFDAAAAAAGSN